MSERSMSWVREVSVLVNQLGAKFMTDQVTRSMGKERGFASFFPFYVVGRGGVLGDVDADVVASAFGFFGPSLVRTGWGMGTSVMAPREAARIFNEACHVWGRTHLTDVDGISRLADLGEKVIEAADPTGLALFAGWRAEPLPDDDPARAAQVLNVLREHRGSAHLVAVLASGLTPVEAIVASKGHELLQQAGWPEGEPVAHHVVQARSAAEDLTDRLVSRAFAALDDDEAAEFQLLLAKVAAAVG